jgi:hypothetical protein
LIAVVYTRAAVAFEQGELFSYVAQDDEGATLTRHFCGACGSPIMITLDRYPEIRSIMGGSVDDKSRLKPTFSLWCSTSQPWLSLPVRIEQHSAYPDGLIGFTLSQTANRWVDDLASMARPPSTYGRLS